MFFFVFFFFKQKTAYEMRISDWSSDVCSSDLSGRVWRDDHINKIRFFSTFHIGPNNFEAYWRALQDFQPDYLVGFPSSVLDLCAMAQERGLQYSGKVDTFFPTAETVLPVHRELIDRKSKRLNSSH